MKAQHFFIFAAAITACALSDTQAGAADFVPQAAIPLIILADNEAADSTSLTAQDFTGGVGVAGGDSSPMVVQMAQPSSGSAPSNAPSSYAYVRPAGH